MSPDNHTTLDQQALQRLQQISAEILGQLDLDRLLASIMTGAADLLNASQINLYRPVPDGDRLETWIHQRAPESIGRLQMQRGEGLAGRVLADGRGLRIDDYDHWSGRSPQWPLGVTGPSMAAPLRHLDELLGILTIARPPDSPLFTDSDLTLLQLFANQAAVAIANAQLYAGATRRAEELARLYDTSLDLVGELDLSRVLQATLERATSLLKSDANLRLYDAERDLLVPLLALRQPEHVAHALLRPGEGLSGRVFHTGEPQVVNDYDNWEGRSPQYAPGVFARSMAAPLRQTGEVIGVLALDRPADRPPFTNDDLRLLTLFANQASIAISNARLYARATRRADELSRLYETSLDVVSQLDLELVLEATLARATALLDSRYANLRLYDRPRDLLVPLVRLNQPDASLQVPLKPGEGLSGRVFLSGEPLIVNDYDHWEGRSPEYPAGSVPRAMGVPLRQAGEVIGVLAVDRTAERPPFSEDDLRLLTLFANQASIAISNARLYADSQLQSQELGHLYETSLDITGRLDLNDLLDAVIRRSSSLIQAQQGEILLYDAERDVSTAFLSLGLDEVGLPADIHSVGLPPDGLDGLVIRSGRAMRIDDYQQWPGRLKTEAPATIGPMLGVPIAHRGQVLGSFSLARAPGEPPFTDRDERRLTLFANQAAVAIANARQVEQLESFHAQQIEKERIDQQLRMAQAVQAGLLPIELPAIPGWDVAARWRPALQLGGDYYDFLPLSPDRWGFVMADVSDKGIPAGLLMAVARSLFRVYASGDLRPSEVLALVNRHLVASSHSGMFVTAVYAVVETNTGLIRISAAGHPPALIGRGPNGGVQPVKIGGMPLGILEEAGFTEAEVKLERHQCLVLYTDGVTEASDSRGEQFSAERLQSVVRRGAAATSLEMIDAFDQALQDFVGDAPQSDDIAYLVIRRAG